MKKLLAIFALALLFSQHVLAQFPKVKNLAPFSISTNTREKPQSKAWAYDGKHFAVLSNNSGAHVFRLDNDTSWTKVLTLSGAANQHADCKVVGNVVHIFMFKEGSSSDLVSIEYVPANSTYKLWTGRTSTVSVDTDDDAETATIDIDTNGRMWMAFDSDTSVAVRWSDPPYSNWSRKIVISDKIWPDDIGTVVAFPTLHKVGVLWSNQRTTDFGFRMHSDSAPDSIWSSDEKPASQYALNVGHGFADDHMNLKVGSTGILYATVKTSYDTPGYTKITLLVRRANGTWDAPYKVSEEGTRGQGIVNEAKNKIRVVYTEVETDGNIYYKESALSPISFGPQLTLIAGKYNNATSMKAINSFENVIIASTSTKAVSVLAVDDPPLPEVPTLVSPGNGATAFPTASNLSWNTALYAKTYQVQVSTFSNFQTLFSDVSNITTLATTVPGLNWSTQYFWRVRATNKTGNSNWSSVRNFTTEPIPVPDAPLLVSPLNSATGITNPPALTWDAATAAATYQVQVATSSSFSTLVSDVSNISTLTTSVSGLNWSTKYYWRVRGINTTGSGSWSAVRYCTTMPIPMPAAPALASPADFATGVENPPMLSWNAGDYAESYQVQVATSSDFLSPVSDISNITTLFKAISGLNWSTSYFWRVRTINSSGISGWSVVRSFTTMPIPVPVAPNLATPANNATGVAYSPTLSWDAVTNAATYQMQLATSSDFVSPVADVSNLTTLNTQVTALAYSTQYFWRVRAANSSGASNWSTVRSFTSVPPPPIPGVPSLSSPSNSATSIAIARNLSWDAASNAYYYQMQLATSPDFLALVSDITNITTLSAPVSGLAYSTKYYWRVRAFNTTGVSTWSTVRNFTTVPVPIPAATVQDLPANTATAITPPAVLSWNATLNAASYRVQISTSTSFSTPLKDVSNITTLNTSVAGLNYSTKYYWRVRAVNTSGSGSWSTVRNFTTMPIPMPGAPALVSPANYDWSVAIQPTLSWNAGDYAESYQVQVATSPYFLSLVSDISNITTLSRSISGLAYGTQYFWRVRTINASGISNWSAAVYNFITVPIPIPAAPTLASPAANATGVAYSPTLSWNSVTHAAAYQLQLATSSDFLSPVADVSSLTTLNTKVNALAFSTQYFWRVRAANSSGAGNWSAVRSFTTVPPPPIPGIPSLASPSNSATSIAIARDLSWNAASNAYYYQMQLATSPDFLAMVNDITNITALSAPVSGLAYNTKYYWRVRAFNTTGISNWSTVRNFTTEGVPAPAAPVQDLPANNATAITLPAVLSWTATVNAASYRVQISTSTSFTTPLKDVSNITTLNTSVSGLNSGTKYYWRVRGVNTSGSGSWSPTINFTTGAIGLPGPPTQASPVDNATAISIPPTLSWNAGANADNYNVQVATSSNFLSPVSDISNITTLSSSISGLNWSTQYFWRVRTINASGASNWTAARSFTTAPQPVTPTGGLVGHWEMEGTGTSLTDASGNGNQATTSGNPTRVTGVFGQALQLNGTSQYATAPSSTSLNVSNAVTLAAWIKPEQTGSAQVVMKKGETGNADGYELSLTSTGKILFRYNQVSAGDNFKVQSNTLHPTNGSTWMHIAATFDGTTIKVYVDGNLDKTLTLTSPPPINSNSLPLAIGAQSSGSNRFMGAIDDARIYSKALSAAEISSLASMSSSRMASGPQEQPHLEAVPNPFQTASKIYFTAQETCEYAVILYNMAGNPVRVLKRGYAKAGEKLTADLDGSKLFYGLYMVRLQTNKSSYSLKLVHDSMP